MGDGAVMTETDGRIDARRPTGDEMLARLRTEQRAGRGRLRVYLGMAPGVGKTYTMLEEAHRRHDRGTDVVVGFVESHGRLRTEALLDGLEVLPRRRIEYRGILVEEMDPDAVIARHPAVALVDELAHTNVPGSPREKRWEDVGVILDAGIDVISTCNVQHVESVADAVETIIGIQVHERLPDQVIRSADEIELVDMSPHALRQRMRHGNVYPPDRTTVALERFFTEPNLTALRDLTLRFVATRADEQLDEIATVQGLERLATVTERVMVVVDERPATRRALRRGAALASAMHAPLLALSVLTPKVERLPFDGELDRRGVLDYADDLGAELVRAESDDLATAIEHVVRDRRVTHLVLAHATRRPLERLLRRSLVDELLTAMPDIEIDVVGAGKD